MFQLTEEQISRFGLTWGLGVLISLMLFIIWDLARKSKAELEAALARVPVVERRLSDFDRSLTQLQSELSVVSGRRREAETAYAVGRDQIISSAEKPISPAGCARPTSPRNAFASKPSPSHCALSALEIPELMPQELS